MCLASNPNTDLCQLISGRPYTGFGLRLVAAMESISVFAYELRFAIGIGIRIGVVVAVSGGDLVWF